MSTQQTVLLVQNAEGSGPGRLVEWITEAGLRPVVLRADAGEPVPTEPGTHAAVVLLGGGLLPDDDARAPWLEAERTLARTCLRTRTPLLGICLGGQLLAVVAGGRVAADHGKPEKGVTGVHIRADARDDPLLGALRGSVPAVESHRDAITALPQDAVWLASSERCPYQAFRLGAAAWGLQMHPEVHADRIASWDPADVRELGFDPEEVTARARSQSDLLEATWSGVLRRFLVLAGTPLSTVPS
ncbi:type 1 glutamine amidotransferase [Luteipulveratus sp. YIM 133132]|uniref:type 1 glutamine amidotransferase n=1 Tax=Luteipulveratus flavus TaxID=3031728 RepID=UPI0023B049B5|nr:type 1 glutamine amidotransferase [Luteipulveratus sp. YIM 133132]MDE9366792.1 type 1 glutamine amidotransferase [Luteipulveratus sp. YIM 133132]